MAYPKIAGCRDFKIAMLFHAICVFGIAVAVSLGFECGFKIEGI